MQTDNPVQVMSLCDFIRDPFGDPWISRVHAEHLFKDALVYLPTANGSTARRGRCMIALPKACQIMQSWGVPLEDIGIPEELALYCRELAA